MVLEIKTKLKSIRNFIDQHGEGISPLLIRIGGDLINSRPVVAYAGYNDYRVHADEKRAILDIATGTWANRYLKSELVDHKHLTFEELVRVAQLDPDVFRAIADIAVLKNELEMK
jgi:hypothetical protein